MSEHKANIKWARNGADFGYKNYSRDHIWRFDNGVEVPDSAAPAYLAIHSTSIPRPRLSPRSRAATC